MKGINWKLRFKNKAVLTAIVGAFLVFLNSVATALGIDISNGLNTVEGIAGAVISLLVMRGVVVDPTSKGVSDSDIAKTYSKPRDSKNPDEYVTWESNTNTLTPKEYDTREAFLDDSDDVDFNSTLLDGGSHPEFSHEVDEEQPENDTGEGLGQRDTSVVKEGL